MIALSIQKILDKQDLTDEERLELVYWFERLQNAPTQLDSLFSGGSARITAASQITTNLGVMTAGKFIAPSSTATSNIPTEAGFTGSFMSGNGETFSSNVYNIGGVNAGVLQWGAKQSDGTLTAGGGVIAIDENGFSIDTPAVAGDQYSYKFTRGGSTVGGLFANQLGANSNLLHLYGTSSVFPRVKITSNATDQTTGAGQVWLLATLTGTITTYAEIILNASPTGSSIVLNSGLMDTDTIVRGDTDGNLIYVDASTDRVGIGTATPTTKLDVVGTITTDGADLDGTVVMNEAGADKDVRIEGDTDANNFFSDASTDRVGIGTSTPTEKLDVVGNIKASGTIAGTMADAELAAIAGLTSAANKAIQFTGSGTAQLVDLILSTTWTPTWTNLSVGNGTVTAKYQQVGNVVFYHLELVFGSTTSVSGTVDFSPPVTQGSYGAVNSPVGISRLFAGGVAYQGAVVAPSTTAFRPAPYLVSGTYAQLSAISATVPGTWTTNDVIQANGSYFV